MTLADRRKIPSISSPDEVRERESENELGWTLSLGSRPLKNNIQFKQMVQENVAYLVPLRTQWCLALPVESLQGLLP